MICTLEILFLFRPDDEVHLVVPMYKFTGGNTITSLVRLPPPTVEQFLLTRG